MADRPSVDVVVPFAGSRTELHALRKRLTKLRLQPSDTVVVVDNTPGVDSSSRSEDDIRVFHAAEVPTPGYARNRGADLGSADWLVFLDADTDPQAGLLDRYFDPLPAPSTGLIGGGVRDQPVPPNAPLALRYAYLRNAMSQADTFGFGEWGYPKSANIACRRQAFEAVGGFRDEIRAAEDADLTYRLRAAGWEVERREAAAVVHFSRATIRGLLRQKALWGAGGAWIDRQYPGSIPLARGPSAISWALSSTIRTLLQVARLRNRDALIYALVRPLEALAWEVGRRRSNERPARRAAQR